MFKTRIIYSFTENQTAELRNLWEAQRPKLRSDEYLFVKVRLGRPEARLTANQTYRMMMRLAEVGVDPIPEWLIALFDPEGA